MQPMSGSYPTTGRQEGSAEQSNDTAVLVPDARSDANEAQGKCLNLCFAVTIFSYLVGQNIRENNSDDQIIKRFLERFRPKTNQQTKTSLSEVGGAYHTDEKGPALLDTSHFWRSTGQLDSVQFGTVEGGQCYMVTRSHY
jgi:hypothetical protein